MSSNLIAAKRANNRTFKNILYFTLLSDTHVLRPYSCKARNNKTFKNILYFTLLSATHVLKPYSCKARNNRTHRETINLSLCPSVCRSVRPPSNFNSKVPRGIWTKFDTYVKPIEGHSKFKILIS